MVHRWANITFFTTDKFRDRQAFLIAFSLCFYDFYKSDVSKYLSDFRHNQNALQFKCLLNDTNNLGSTLTGVPGSAEHI